MSDNNPTTVLAANPPKAWAIWPTADAVFGATRPAKLQDAIKLFRATARARLLNGQLVRPDLKTSLAAVRSFDGGLGSFNLAVEHGAYLPALDLRG